MLVCWCVLRSSTCPQAAHDLGKIIKKIHHTYFKFYTSLWAVWLNLEGVRIPGGGSNFFFEKALRCAGAFADAVSEIVANTFAICS